jgi:murein DD-endopeptidase MepM/ murein hydrolase activator NlpD
MSFLYPIKSRNIDGRQQTVTKTLPISSAFGPRGSGFHNGIDIPVPVGSYFQAPFDGYLSNSVNPSGGNQVIITSVDSTQRFGFAHLKNLEISDTLIDERDGRPVSKGTIIGLSGNTGNSTGPHLHLTYTLNGEKKDPAKLSYDFTNVQPPIVDPGPVSLPLPVFPGFAIIIILILILLVTRYLKGNRGIGNIEGTQSLQT